jgi:small subunit ribosomal protein S19
MPRSLKKGPFISDKLLRKVTEAQGSRSSQVIKTWSRRSTIVPEMVGVTLAVHNGRKFIPVFISENMDLLRACQRKEVSINVTNQGN